MKLYTEYYNKLFILWFNTYILKKHNLVYNKEKKIHLTFIKYFSLLLQSFSITLIVCMLFGLIFKILEFDFNYFTYHIYFILFYVCWIISYIIIMKKQKNKQLYLYDYNHYQYHGLRRRLLEESKYIQRTSTHNKINKQIKEYNEYTLNKYKENRKQYYLYEKSKIMSPKEKKEILNYFKS